MCRIIVGIVFFGLILVGLLIWGVAGFPTPFSATPDVPETKGNLTVHFFDVGQGDCILIGYGDQEVLIDAGADAPDLSGYVDGPIEEVIATHPHADHIGGFPEVFNSYEVERFWTNGDIGSSTLYTQVMSLATEAQIDTPVSGETVLLGDFSLTFYLTHGSTNNESIVTLLTYGTTEFLFMGDLEKEGEAALLSNFHDIDVLKVGHHGSCTSTSTEFLKVVKPEIAIYSAGLGNSYGHPCQETLDRLSIADIYGTDKDGDILLVTDGKVITVR